ncbi:cell division protein FtsK [Streptomyces sp. H10-C2]|uniref:cell division protein FtsK n=1 Tax=unclassified Streptomyces TaxID=2593676 RepID=UPI0024B8D850|nr:MULTISPECIES: cell division protein FtsK [unclassified Streptomyces]MDJ0346960.1 cell division protein FtsK [Streptomyces sp. PH10-H1]MDJ0374625.1 cell division protein FtsK [Streptomyces sp. H10-C2]
MTAQTTMSFTALRNAVHITDPHTVRAVRGSERVLLGLAAGDVPVYLPEGDGHVLVATGGGGGTTTVLRSLAAQALRRGAHVDVLDLDRRRSSHPWAAPLPRVQILDRIEQIHDYLVDQLDQLRQYDRASAAGAPQRRLIVIEHGDRTVDALRQYWGLTRPDSQLADAPGIEALGLLLAAGRAGGLQIAFGSTRGVAPYLGTQVRDVFVTRVVAYGGQTLWTRIAPEVWPVPPYSVIPGRMHVVQDGTTTRLQALYLAENEARAWARGTVPKEYK